MTVWVIEKVRNDRWVFDKVASSFEKAKDITRNYVLDDLKTWGLNKEEEKEVLEAFEVMGHIDDLIHISEQEVD